MISKAYEDYINSTEQNINVNPQTFWGLIKQRRKPNHNTSQVMKSDNKIYEDPQQIADEFTIYFKSVYFVNIPSYGVHVDQEQVIPFSLFTEEVDEEEYNYAIKKLKAK